jgi:3-hydroxybutyryl-CoA dehydrogenase
VLCARHSLAARDDQGAAGFHLLPPMGESRLVELTVNGHTEPRPQTRAVEFFSTLGYLVEWVGDAPGLVLGRIVAQLVNEAAFAIGEEVGSATDIDVGMALALNHPRGPVAWANAASLSHILRSLVRCMLSEAKSGIAWHHSSIGAVHER